MDSYTRFHSLWRKVDNLWITVLRASLAYQKKTLFSRVFRRNDFCTICSFSTGLLLTAGRLSTISCGACSYAYTMYTHNRRISFILGVQFCIVASDFSETGKRTSAHRQKGPPKRSFQIVKEATLQFCKVASIIEITSCNKDRIHLWMANFFKLSAANLSLTHAVTAASPRYGV